MKPEQESFWDAEKIAVVSDKTKPAMEWTIGELSRRGKKVYVVDMSEEPAEGALTDLSLLPDGIDCAVIGVTKTEPANIVRGLEKKGIGEFWIHWMTETPEIKKLCGESKIHCITGKCPMMYLASGINMHTMHRFVWKLVRKY